MLLDTALYAFVLIHSRLPRKMCKKNKNEAPALQKKREDKQ